MGMTTSHRMRARVSRALIITTTAMVMGAGSSLTGTTSDAATVHAPAPHVSTVELSPSVLACELSGTQACGHLLACWYERDDRMCGWADQAPHGAYDFQYGDWLSRDFADHSTTT
jgi:hypothetical protein